MLGIYYGKSNYFSHGLCFFSGASVAHYATALFYLSRLFLVSLGPPKGGVKRRTSLVLRHVLAPKRCHSFFVIHHGEFGSWFLMALHLPFLCFKMPIMHPQKATALFSCASVAYYATALVFISGVFG